MRRYFLISLNIILILGIGINIKGQQNNPESERFVYQSTRTGVFADGVFVYKDENTSVSGKFLEGFGGECVFCTAGTNISFYTSFLASPFLAGHPGLVNGRLYKNVYFSGSAVLNGGDYRLPYRWTRGRFTVIRPATLTGQLSFHSENFNYQNPTIPFFTKQLSLQGTVTATLEMTQIIVNPSGEGVVPYFKLIDLKYDFSSNPQINNENAEKEIQSVTELPLN
jgi:hypothetical protein